MQTEWATWGYCYKHRKAVVPGHVVAAVGQVAEPKRKFKYSAFRWTINSNTSTVGMNVDQVAEFKRLIGFVFDKGNVEEYLVDRNSADDPKANLDELDSVYFFEIAPTTHALHAHGVVKLKHHGMYSLSTDVIREVIAGVLGKKVHVNVQASGDADAAWAQYMQKNQAAEQV